jgi:hypothetical protein
MIEPDTGDTSERDQDHTDISGSDSVRSDIPAGMTLESIIDMTGEMKHLHELVMLHVEKSGGVTCPASYFTLVSPILDMLEEEIRFRYHDGMTKEQIKYIVRDWINKEIAGMQCVI